MGIQQGVPIAGTPRGAEASRAVRAAPAQLQAGPCASINAGKNDLLMSTVKRELIMQEAEQLAARGKLDAAIKQYKRAVDLAPHDTNALNRLGDLLVRVSRIPEAIDVYQRI